MSSTSVDARLTFAQARRGLNVGLAAVFVVVIAAPSASAAHAANQPPPLTAEAAKEIVRRYDTANAKNNATLDVQGQDAIETEPLGQIDDTSYADARGRGETRLGGRFDIGQVVAIPPKTAKRSARVRGVGLYDGFVAATGDPLGTPATPPGSPSIPTPTTPITQEPSIPE